MRRSAARARHSSLIHDSVLSAGECADRVLETLDDAKPALFRALHREFGNETVAKALTLKIQNLCLAKYHFLSRSTQLASRPFGLSVDPSNACNLACPGCVQSTNAKSLKLFDWKNGLLTLPRFESLMERYGP